MGKMSVLVKNTGILVKSRIGRALQFMFAYELKPV